MMKRGARFILKLLLPVGLLLGAGILVLWVRSYYVSDRIVRGTMWPERREAQGLTFQSNRGRIEITSDLWTFDTAEAFQGYHFFFRLEFEIKTNELAAVNWAHVANGPVENSDGGGWLGFGGRSEHIGPRAAYNWRPTTTRIGSFTRDYSIIFFPHWIVAVMFLLPPLALLLNSYRASIRKWNRHDFAFLLRDVLLAHIISSHVVWGGVSVFMFAKEGFRFISEPMPWIMLVFSPVLFPLMLLSGLNNVPDDLERLIPFVIIYGAYLLCGGLVFRLLWKRGRSKRRVRSGLCPVCGYDIRATPGRCPECGTAQAGSIKTEPESTHPIR